MHGITVAQKSMPHFIQCSDNLDNLIFQYERLQSDWKKEVTVQKEPAEGCRFFFAALPPVRVALITVTPFDLRRRRCSASQVVHAAPR